MPKKTLLEYRLEYLALRGLAVLLCCLPRKLALTVGGWLGLLTYRLLPQRREVGEQNLRQAFPELDQKQIDDLLRANFRQFGISGVEMLRLNLLSAARGDLERYFDVDLDEVRKAHELGRGVIMLTGHFGFWEGGTFPLKQLGYQVDVVAKQMKNRLVSDYFERLRLVHCNEVIDNKRGPRPILKALQQGHLVAVLLDQHFTPPGAVQVDFFGRKAYTATAITNLAMRYQVPVVPIFVQRQADYRYKVWTEPMLLLEGAGAEAVEANTQLLTDRIEAGIRNDITQWFWVHKRWKDRKRSSGRKKKRMRSEK